MRTTRDSYPYDACGLPGITLVGVEVSRCPECGETEVSIPNIEGLHRAIARVLARKPHRLTPAEIRFLRKYLGFSGGDFAEHVGVVPETVSRWENGATAMGLTAERLLRWMVVTREPLSEYPLDMLRVMGEQDTVRPVRVNMAIGGGNHWRESVRAIA
jgi:putative zinc finger/helix-turn-helix YgiT family protein